MNIEITRVYQHDCTVGVLNFGILRFFTLELPDLGNEKNVSCIPAGEYKTRVINSPSLGKCIEVLGVDNRTYIRIHAGNYTRQVKGCILVGDSLKDIDKDGIIDVTNSVNTLNKIMGAWKTGTKLIIK